MPRNRHIWFHPQSAIQITLGLIRFYFFQAQCRWYSMNRILLKGLVICFFIGSALFLLFGSMSGHFAAAFMTAVVFTVFMRKEIKKRYKWYFALVMYGIMIFLLMNSYSKGLLLEELKKTNPFYNKNTDKIHFKDVSLFGDSATIRTNKWTLNIKTITAGLLLVTSLGTLWRSKGS